MSVRVIIPVYEHAESPKNQESPQDAEGLEAGAQLPARQLRRSSSLRWTNTVSVCNNVTFASSFSELSEAYRASYSVREAQLRFLKILGEGSFAIVEKAKLSFGDNGERDVAVKHLKDNALEDTDSKEQLLRELKLLQVLKHKHIVEFIGVGSLEKTTAAGLQHTVFIVQEYMESGSLNKLIRTQMLMNPRHYYSNATALRWLVHVAKGLAYLHSKQPMVIHRDLKPENILMTGRKVSLMEAKLADFGLAALADIARQARKSRSNVACGTPTPTMSPSHKSADFRLFTDDFSVPASPATVPPSPFSNISRQERLQECILDESLVVELPEATTLNSLMRLTSSLRFGSQVQSTPSSAEGSAMPPPSLLRSLSASFSNMRLLLVPRAKPQTYSMTGATGSLMYMAPEVFKHQMYNEKCDVFSFAMVMYELLHRYLTLHKVSMTGTQEEMEGYAFQVSQGHRPEIQQNLPTEIKNLITACWAQDPDMRPSMSQVVELLEAVQQSGEMEEMDAQRAKQCC